MENIPIEINYDKSKINTKMELNRAQESTEKSKVFQIPIDKYESDMETELAKEKKKEILELFTKDNKLRSEKEFDDIEYYLHEACREGDLELIKILLSETIENSTNAFKFKIDKTNQTASLFKVENNSNSNELFIPRTVEHESTEYLITNIVKINCNAKTIKFSKDSAVKTFYKCAFSSTKIEEIHFLSSLKELKEGWFDCAPKLKKIIVSPLNSQYEFKEDKYLVCKSDSNNDDFDQLLFVRRDIEKFSIPSNIKIISSYSFKFSNIKEIFIPSNVLKICECAFCFCTHLTKVEIPTNSNLQTIGPNAFSYSNIESISIPSSVSKICKCAFTNCKNLKKIEIPTNSNLQTIGPNAFSSSNIESILIPSSVLKICEDAFSNCENLKKIDIPTNSNLQTIGPNAFSSSNIESILIPSSVLKICEDAFSNCENLKKIDIPTNSNLQTIGKHAFSYSQIESIYLPLSLKELEKGWCFGTKNLKKIIVSPLNSQYEFKEDKYLVCKSDSNNDDIDQLLFVRRDIEKFSIPSNIKIISSHSFDFSNIKEIFIPSNVLRICECAFLYCQHLTKVEIPTNSNLQTIESSAFSYSKIESISIPSSVSKICKFAFSDCKNLKKIEIPTNSNLPIIESYAFSMQEFESIFIPSSVSKICEDAFSYCKNLQIMEISEKSELNSISLSVFKGSEQLIIMIPSTLRILIE